MIKACSCIFTFFLEKKGKFGISVNRNKHVGGTDIIKLYEIAAALSVRLRMLKFFVKKLITSYRLIPSNPGGFHLLLLSTKNVGGFVFIIRSGLIKRQKDYCTDFKLLCAYKITP